MCLDWAKILNRIYRSMCLFLITLTRSCWPGLRTDEQRHADEHRAERSLRARHPSSTWLPNGFHLCHLRCVLLLPVRCFQGPTGPEIFRLTCAVVGPICFLDLVCTHKTTVWIKVHTRRLCDAHYADGSLCTALIRARACICAVLCAALITMCFSALNVTWSIIMHFGLEQVRETSLPPGSVRQNSSPSVAMR